jgi:hypothetical protein
MMCALLIFLIMLRPARSRVSSKDLSEESLMAQSPHEEMYNLHGEDCGRGNEMGIVMLMK